MKKNHFVFLSKWCCQKNVATFYHPDRLPRASSDLALTRPLLAHLWVRCPFNPLSYKHNHLLYHCCSSYCLFCTTPSLKLDHFWVRWQARAPLCFATNHLLGFRLFCKITYPGLSNLQSSVSFSFLAIVPHFQLFLRGAEEVWGWKYEQYPQKLGPGVKSE